MVDINGKNYSDIIKIKGSNEKINLTKLEGLQRTEQNKAIFDMADHNHDGVIDKKEALSLQGLLLTASKGDGTLTKREANNLFGKQSNALDAISTLACQQEAFENDQVYIETNGNKTSHINKTKSYSYTQEKNDNGTITTTLDDGTVEIKFPDNSYKRVHTDGSIETFDENGNKTSVMKDGNTTTFPDKNTSITKNSENQTIQTINCSDGQIVKTKFEYQDGKTIEREYSDITDDAPLTQITVREQKDGHKIDTKYTSEEDMTNNKPSEIVTDAHNPTQKTVTKYTYNEDGTYSTETTDSAGNKTVKNFNADGTEIVQNEAPTTHTVEKGESITSIVKNALAQQGITEPTADQLKEAKQEFLELNKDIVKTYNGKNTQWKGNKFFYPNDVVKIPNYNKTTETKSETVAQDDEDDGIDGGELKEFVFEAKRPTEEVIARKNELQEKLGDEFIVEYDKDGKIVVKDHDGNILPEATKKANNPDGNNVDITDMMMLYDDNKSNTIDKEEYKQMMKSLINDGIEITDSNIMNLIEESFNSIDIINQDQVLTKEELMQNAQKVIVELLNSLESKGDN